MQNFAQFLLFCALKGRAMKKNIAIFASGYGSNAENLIRFFAGRDSAQVALVLTNKENAYVVNRARSLQVPCCVCPKEDWVTGERVLAVLQEYHVDFIVLAGFLMRVPDLLLQVYPHRIVNIHPALLPKYGGKGMYGMRVHEAVVAAGERQTGITIHYINGQYDEGDIIAQFMCNVLPEDSPEEVAQKVHALEYAHYPVVIARLVEEVSVGSPKES